MDDVIICPNCGESNPADLPYCRNCQWRLRSLDPEWGTGTGTPGEESAGTPFSEGASDAQVPEWLQSSGIKGLGDKSADEDAAAELRERLAAAGAEDMLSAPTQQDEPYDLLAGLSKAEGSDDEPIPDWVARIMGISESDEAAHAQESAASRDSDYPQGFQFQESPQAEPAPAAPPATRESDARPARDDGASSQQSNSPTLQTESDSSGRQSEDIYEWLRQLDANNAPPPVSTSRRDVPATTDVPTWVGRMMGVSAEDAEEVETGPSSLPDWLKPTDPADYEPPSPHQVPPLPITVLEPSSLRADEAQIPMESEEPASTPTVAEEVAPAPAEPEIDSLDVDAVFAAMDLPQSFGAAPALDPEAPGTPSAASDDEPISPADLPSWVQAMQPLESTVSTTASAGPASPRVSAGPLIGLQGVLPAIPGTFVPTNRPKSHAMKLEVSEKHASQARWLEEILASEARPLPTRGSARTRGSRVVRWLIAVVLFVLIGIGLRSALGVFVFPAGVPTETNAAIQTVQNIPADSRVLTVFDYEPATAGELEAVAASLMDHLLLLKHPRLAVLSTSPTGSALAERFISVTLRDRSYARNVQYADLGYLPGGLAGVQMFAQDPVAALQYGAAADRVWDSPVLQGTTALTDFDAIIVLTDSQEAGALWIEQTAARRGSTPMVILASAQSGPLLLPYYDSGQIQGLISGISGAVGAEIANGGRPGLIRLYWDAYNLGLYAAVVLIIMGALRQIVLATAGRSQEISK